ncbi:MAG: enolase C-terminal domain-like protein [Verrucomicrobiota bacterium]
MMGPIYISRYELKSATALNSVTAKKTHEGALIRIGSGCGCLHPWPELGDAPLSEQLQILAAGGKTPLIEGALRCASEDGEAREAGVSLFSDPIPPSHWLALPGDDPRQAKEEGFEAVKLKIGRDLVDELEVMERWHDAGFALRLDGNESLSLSTFLEFWETLGGLREHVELVEDPVRWDPETWRILRETGISVAFDREVESRWQPGSVAVIKPATTQWLPPSEARILVTSYMDHAIGQCWASIEAARIAKERPTDFLGAGLLTHRCFETDPFFEKIETEGPFLLPPTGTGLGFDDLLEDLEWELLT